MSLTSNTFVLTLKLMKHIKLEKRGLVMSQMWCFAKSPVFVNARHNLSSASLDLIQQAPFSLLTCLSRLLTVAIRLSAHVKVTKAI